MELLKEYKKILIMLVVLVILVIGIVVVTTANISIGGFDIAAFYTISDSKSNVNSLIQTEATTRAEHQSAIDALEKAKKNYAVEKEKFDNIGQSTIDLVKDATKDEKYFIEYLWITLGNYAEDNNLTIDVITQGSTSASTGETVGGSEEIGNNNQTVTPGLDTSVENNAIKIIVKGRYANVADFVYDVENDKELKFRLDNIKMVYKSNNQIEATFSILSLQVKK